MLARIATALTRFSSRWVPDAWIIAVLLTLFTAALALSFTDSGPDQVVQVWGDGFWALLPFAMQMCLVIMSGYMLSTAPPVRRLLEGVAGLAKSPRSAVVLMALLSLLLGWLNWGLSVAASAVLVRHIARRQPGVDYRLLVCAAYFGVATIWHAGLSGSAPLLVATQDHFLVDSIGVIPITDTLLAPFNLGLCLTVLLLMPLLVFLLHPTPDQAVCVDPARLEEALQDQDDGQDRRSPAFRLENSPLINLIVAVPAFYWLLRQFQDRGLEAIHLNSVNFAFLFLAVLLHWRPSSFLRAASESGRFVWGIAVQFPFYAGIFGILQGTGLSELIAQRFSELATSQTYPAFVLLYSGFLNYIVPSGGSQWAVSGEYIMSAANSLGVRSDTALLAYSWGDMSTNLIQPFWAIPLLTVAGLKFRDIMGFGLILFVLYMSVLVGAFLLLGAL